ncbi:MAG TPA: nitrate/sulfonate/bicarbonate ABC transporter ATP-binding protein [Usitatibacter sp.]|nr:nitrate/sulfonate/bicarbonate ABC transporter ATP-binding protein [Usitatibacter sp.]
MRLPAFLQRPAPAPVSPPVVVGDASTLVELHRVSKTYEVADGGPDVRILDDIDLTVREGEMLALLGQSGSGKSTILRLVAGLTKPTQGTVLRHGTPLEGVNPDVAIVFQSFALYPWLTVEENVEVGIIRRRVPREEAAGEIQRAIDLIGLAGYENAYPKQLSGGMRQRVGFARALVARPEVLLMDEAFSALDILTAENLRNEVVKLWQDRANAGLKSLFFVTHNIEEAVFMASRILVMSSHPGRITTEIVNPLPWPRDPNAASFEAMMNQVRAAITALALPDQPAERTAAAGRTAPLAEAPASSQRIESIPNVPVALIVGLLEVLEANDESINVFDLSARIAKDFGETIAIVKAAEMLNLVDTPKDEVHMLPPGWYFLAAPLAQRKTLFHQAIERLRLFQIIEAKLAEAPDERMSADEVKEMLATLLPYDEREHLFQTIVAWGRFADILDYDQDDDTVFLIHEDEGEDADEPKEPR